MCLKKSQSILKYIMGNFKALVELKERGGSSRQAILKYIMANFKVGTDEHAVNSRLKVALRNGIKSASLKQSKGTGATGSFRLGENQPKVKKAITASKSLKSQKTASPKKTSKPKKAAGVPASPKKTGSKPKIIVPKTKAVKNAKAHVAKPISPKKAKTPSTPKPKIAKKSAKPKKITSPKKKLSKKA